MSTTNIATKTITEALAARAAKHNECQALLVVIEAAQNTIVKNQHYIDTMNPAASYFIAVTKYHAAEVEKHRTIRNEAVVKYDRLMWSLHSATLPIFGDTEKEFREVSVTLYSSHTATVQL